MRRAAPRRRLRATGAQGGRDLLSDVRGELLGIAIAALGGAAVGIERQRAYRENEPGAIGGLRTFALLGTVAGTCGLLILYQAEMAATTLLAAAAGMVLIVRLAAGKLSRDATTEMAALAVLVSGVAAGLGHLVIAAALYALTLLLLIEKAELHALVQRIGRRELEAAAQFAAMALIVLPLLPTRNFGPQGVLNLRSIWILVLVFSGISFAGYLLRKGLGSAIGWVVTGSIGGLISSTQVAFSFARESRNRPESHLPLFGGAMSATAVSMLRICAVCLLLRPALAATLLACVAMPVLLGLGLAWYSQRRAPAETASVVGKTPLSLFAALYLSLIFVAAQFAAAYARAWLGTAGVVGSAGLLGSFDIDALVASAVPLLRAGMPTAEAAFAITVGIVGNTVVKCGAAVLWGRGRFRQNAILGFAGILAALALSLVLLSAHLN